MSRSSAAHVKLTAAILIGLGAVVAAVWRPRVERPVERPEPVAAPRAAIPITPAEPPARPEPAADPAPASPPLEEIISRSLPSVVRVETPTGLGSGFYVAPGVIVTNAHVVNTNTTVAVRHASGTVVQGTVFSSSRGFDLAIVKVPPVAESGAPLPIGSALRARPGREIVALGSPLGLQNTVTRGIVSAVRQSGPVMLVQTDAAINPGNSGGPLLDNAGQVIAVATLTVKPAEGHGLSFGVAIEHVQALLEGRLPTVSGATPLSMLNRPPEATPPPPPSASPAVDEPDAREVGARTYEQTVAQLAAEADALDSRFRSFVSACYIGQLRGSFARPWFVLFEPRAFDGMVATGCEAAFADIKGFAGRIQDAVRAADEAARRADVYPGMRRGILQKYRLDYERWTP